MSGPERRDEERRPGGSGAERLEAAASALREMAARFGPPIAGPPVLHYGDLAGDHASAIELVYEGYLMHYRASRVLDGLSVETRLLAGDYFYAHGLRRVAQAYDTAAIHLLTRLMSACSYYRAEEADFELDDGLWEVTARAVGDATRRAQAARAFDEVEAAIAVSAPAGDLVRRAVDESRRPARLA